MKLARMSFFLATFAVVFCSAPEVTWATRVFSTIVTGEVTARPMSSQIEVDHHVFHFTPNSPADKAARNITVGQVVDLVLDAPASTAGVHVVSIVKHSGS